MAPKRPILFCLVYQEVFSHFPTIPDHLRRFPKNTEDFRRLPKISAEKSENFRLYFVVTMQCNDLQCSTKMTVYVIPSLSKAHGYVPYQIVQMFLQLKAKMSADGTARSADRYVRWGIIVHIAL